MNQSGDISLIAIVVSSMPPLIQARGAIDVIIRSHSEMDERECRAKVCWCGHCERQYGEQEKRMQPMRKLQTAKLVSITLPKKSNRARPLEVCQQCT